MHPRCGQLALNELGVRRVKAFVALASSFPAFEISFVAGDAISSNIGSSVIRIEPSDKLHARLKISSLCFT